MVVRLNTSYSFINLVGLALNLRAYDFISQELRATVRKEGLEGMSDWGKPSFQASFLPEDDCCLSLNLGGSNAVQRNAMLYLGKYNGKEYQQ